MHSVPFPLLYNLIIEYILFHWWGWGCRTAAIGGGRSGKYFLMNGKSVISAVSNGQVEGRYSQRTIKQMFGFFKEI